MANPLNISLKVVGLDQAKAELQSFATIGKRSFNEIAQEAKNFAQSAATTDPALRGVANRVRNLAAATDEAFASNIKLRQSISDIERAFKAEMISAESATKMTAALRAEHEKLANSTKLVVAEIKQIETIGKLSYSSISAMAQRAATDIKPTAQSTHDLAVAMRELSLAADPAAAAQTRLLSGLTQVKSALDQKIISTRQAAQLEIYLREQSQAAARAEAELENKVRSAAAARAQASIQAANAQKAASQIAVAAIRMEINEIEALQKKTFTSGTATNLPVSTGRGAGPAAGSQAQVDLAAQMRGLAAAANPLGVANKEYLDTLRAVDFAVKKTIISEEQSAVIKQHLISVLDKQVAAINRETAAHKNGAGGRSDAAQSISKMGNTITQLSFQLNDVATSLASGASPFMVIAQQAGQIFQLLQTAPGGVRGAMDAIGSAFMKLLTPIGLASAALLGIGAAMAAIFATQQEMESKSRKFNVVLEGMGDKSGATAEDFHRMELNLRALGLSAEEAAAGLSKVMTLPGINRQQLDKVVELGANLGAVTGEGTEAASARVGQMISDKDIEKLIELGIVWGKFDASLIKTIRDMRDANNLIGATDKAVDALSGNLKGKHADAATDFAKAVTAMGNAWKGLMENLTLSSFFTEGMNRITTTLNEIKAITDAIDNLSKRFTRTGDQATQLAQAARAESDAALVERRREAGDKIPEAGTARFENPRGLPFTSPELQRLKVLAEEGSKILPEGFTVQATSTIASRASGTRGHPDARAMDLQIVSPSGPLANQGPIGADPGWYKQLAIAMYDANKKLFADAPFFWGGRVETERGSRQEDWMHVAAEADRASPGITIPPIAQLAADAQKATENYILQVNEAFKAGTISAEEAEKRMKNARAEVARLSVIGGPGGAAAGAAPGGASAPGAPAAAPATAAGVATTRDQTDALTKQNTEYQKALAIAKTYGFAQIAETARTEATTRANDLKYEGEVREKFIKDAVTNATNLKIAALQTEGKITDETTARNVAAVAGAKTQEEAYRNLATAEAQRRVGAAQGVEVDKETARILNANAEAAVRAAKQSVLAAEPQIAAQQRVAEAAKLGGEEQRKAQIQLEVTTRFQDALTQARVSGDATLIKEIESTKALAAAQLEAGKAADIDTRINQQDRLTDSTLKTAQSARTLAESYRAQAAAQADLNVATGQANNTAAETERILKQNAINAIAAATQANFLSERQVTNQEKIAAASLKGTVAQREAEMAAAANAKTQDVVAKAEATRTKGLEDQAKALQATALAEEKRIDAARQTTAIGQRISQRTDQIALVTQQTGMVGQLPENIEAANAKLTEQQALLNADKKLTDDIAIASLKNVDALNKANIAHAEAQRQQQRIDSMYQQIGSTIENAIGNVIDGIFDPKKAMDWGKAVKDMTQQMFKGMVTNFFTKPLLGDLLGIMGASQTVVSQYGSLFGMGGGTTAAGGAAAGGSSGLFGGSTLGMLVQGGSLFSKGGIFGSEGVLGGVGGSGGMFSGVSNFFSGGAGGIFAHTGEVGQLTAMGANGVASASPIMGTIPGSVFGGTTLGGAAMGVGIGFAGGSMLNSLLGRKNGQQMTGMIGSGVGSLAGLALTPLLGPLGPILGGLAGGALGGMFGNPRGSNMSAGGSLNLQNFRVEKGFTGGDPEINQQVQQIGQSLQSFLALLQTTGGKISGSTALVQSGVNTGITIDSDIEGYKGRFELGKDTDTAIKVIEQALVKSITGVSETMKTVLSQVGTDEDISKAIAFANAYDDLKKATADAFKTVEDASKQIGPFATVMNEINALFADLTVSATRFGLSLDPLTAGLAEATKRLQGDFQDSINEAMNAATDKGYRNQIQELVNNYTTSLNEAFAIGLSDRATNDALGQLFTKQINEVLAELTPAELSDVVAASFTGFNDVIDNLALAATGASDAVDDLATRLKNALIGIQDYIDEFRATPGSTVSPETALKESQAQFLEMMKKAQGGDIGALEGITGKADQYIKAILSYYGSSQAGAGLTDQIMKDLESLLGTKEVHEDPTLITNTILNQTNQLMQDQINATTANTTALTASNDAMAKALIAGNNADTTTIINTTNKTAEDNINANNAATALAIEEAKLRTADLLAQADAQKLAIVAANEASSKNITDKNVETTNGLISNTNDATADIIAQGDINSGALISSGQNTTAQIIEQATKDSDKAIQDAKDSSAAIIAQNESDKVALIAAGDSTTKDLLKSAGDATAQAMADAKLNTDSVAGWGQATVTTIGVWGDATVNTIKDWSKSIITATFDSATSAAAMVEVWGTATCLHIAAWGKATVDVIAAWAPLQIAQINDSATNVINTIALWVGASMTNEKDLINSTIVSNTGLANSLVTAIYDNGTNTVKGMEIWVSKQMENDKTLTNSLINVGATYSAADTISTYGAANSLISAEALYSNNIILAIQNQRDVQITWFTAMNNNIFGIYNSSEQGNAISLDMRTFLRDIRDALQLLANQPPYWREDRGSGL